MTGRRRERFTWGTLFLLVASAGLAACRRGDTDTASSPSLSLSEAQAKKPIGSRSPDMSDGGSKAVAPGRPAYLDRWPGLSVREGDRVVEAAPEEAALARRYPEWTDKGPAVEGRRISIAAARRSVAVGEEVRVVHVAEVMAPGRSVYVMGPKAIAGESLDGTLATPPAPTRGDPLEPLDYDGKTLPSPAVDYGYDLTRYRFTAPGTHRIRWTLGALQSNELVIEVTAGAK